MKKLVLSVFSIFLVVSLSANDLTINDLFGNVKSVVTEIYEFKIISGELNKTERTKMIFNLNAAGYFTERNWYNFYNSHSIHTKELFKYADNGVLLESSFYWGEKLDRRSKYNESGDLIEKAYYLEDGRYWILWIYSKDGNGKKVVESDYNNEGVLSSVRISYYNEKNEIKNIEFYNGKNEIDTDTKFELVSDGYLIRYGMKSPSTLVKYNKKDKMLEELRTYSDLQLGFESLKTIYKYDSRNNLLEESCFNSDNTLRTKHCIGYDLLGKIISEYYYSNSDKIGERKYIYNYEYDSVGNWTKKTRFKINSKFEKILDEPVEVENRIITYYP